MPMYLDTNKLTQLTLESKPLN